MSADFNVYIAGPLSDQPPGYLANVARLGQVSRELTEAGYITLNPAADLIEGLMSATPWPLEMYQQRSLGHLRMLQYVPHGALYVDRDTSTSTGQPSRGVAREIMVADDLLIPVFYSRADLDLWRIRAQAEAAR